MSKLVVTGGAGFIGSHLTDALVALGHEVFVVDNLMLGKKEFINKKAKFYKADIRDYKKISKILEKIERSAKRLLILSSLSCEIASACGIPLPSASGKNFRSKKTIKSITLGTYTTNHQPSIGSRCKKILYASSTALTKNTEISPITTASKTNFRLNL